MEPPAQPADSVTVELTRAELELIRSALRNLESIMGHDEAELLEHVQRLLAKLAG
jgi:hypothetical protein